MITTRTLWLVLIAIFGPAPGKPGAVPADGHLGSPLRGNGPQDAGTRQLGNPAVRAGRTFLGKPPLSFWTQALGMKLLGINEFAIRFPAWLLHVASCLIIIRFAREQVDEKTAVSAAIIFSSSTLGLLSAGVVLTDPALSFSVLLASYGFWCGMTRGDRRWALAGFAGLGLGLLAKGPLVLVLVGGSSCDLDALLPTMACLFALALAAGPCVDAGDCRALVRDC